MTIFIHELKLNIKSLLIWSVCVGFSCFGCLCLFGGLKESMEGMDAAYAQMGAFSTALGLDRLSVSTMEGFYATEVALIFAIGGAMFAGMCGACLLSKEEEGHTSEFLYTLPLGRGYIVLWKYAAMAALILLFDLLCILWAVGGFVCAGEGASLKALLSEGALPLGGKLPLFHMAQLLMHLEIGSVCFFLSALCRKKQVGAALGLAILLYVMDLMCRIMPDLEKLKYVTPYYFSNAADIFVNGSMDWRLAGIGVCAAILAVAAAFLVYGRKDLQA